MRLNKSWLSVILLAAAVIVCYANIFQNGFVWDDKFYIVDNTHIRDARNIPGFFAEPSPGNLYRPVRTAFYAMTYSVWQLNPIGYHINSIILHLSITLLVFFIFLKITKSQALSFLASLIFAVHPSHVERVTNMTASFDMLGILLMMLSFLFYMHNSKKALSFALTAVFYTLALFASEEAIVFIPLLLLYEFSVNMAASIKSLKELIIRLAPLIIISIAYMAIRLVILGQIGREDAYFKDSFAGTILTTITIFVKYIIVLIYPVDVSIERYVYFHNTVFSLSFITYFITLALIIVLWIKSYNEVSKTVFFSIGWFFIALLPFSNIFPQVTIMADRYLYTASAGFCLLAAFLILQISRIGQIKKYSNAIVIITSVCLVVAFSIITIRDNLEWKDDFTLLTSSIQKNPYGTRTYNALALYYRNNADYANAIRYAKSAIALSSGNYKAYENLGTTYAIMGDYNKSIYYYKEALSINSGFYLALNNLGLVYSFIGDYDNSILYLLKAISSNPGLSKAHYDIAVVYAKTGNIDLAGQEFLKAIEISPENENYRNGYDTLKRYTANS